MQLQKPYSESCVQNREPILAVLKRYLGNVKNLLEIGSGTGQHAVYFAPEFPQLSWQTSDQAEYHPGISAWLAEATRGHIQPPIRLNVMTDPWPQQQYSAVFSANTAHIMGEAAVEAMIEGVGKILENDGIFLLYGPFNINNQFTSESNERFEHWLKSRDLLSGIKDKGWLTARAVESGMELVDSIEMPANNKILVWRKRV